MRKLINVILAFSLVVSVFALTSCDSGKSKKKEKETYEVELNLNDYFKYEVLGEYDGAGYIEYTIDFDALWESNKKLHRESKEEFLAFITGSFDVSENLSNGDVATWSWSIDEDAINDFYEDEDVVVDIKYKDITVNIEGLLEKAAFNPIDYVDVSFEGISPFGEAKLTAIPCDCSLAFEVDFENNLTNGDTVTVKLKDSFVSTVEAYCEENNFVLGDTSATYTVENLDEYLVSVDQLTDDMISMMSEQAINVFHSYTSGWEEEAILVSIEYDGVYFLNSRYPDNLWNKNDMNHCYILLKVT